MIKQQLDTLTFIINKAIQESLSNTHTSTIAKVTKINGGTICVKPVFKRVIDNTEVELPEFTDVPALTLQGGANYRIMPITIGDFALLIFNERCIDDWFVGGADNKKPRESRMHDYSDAIAIVGLNKLSDAITIPTGHEEVQGDIVHTGNYTLEGDITQTGEQNITGDVNASNFTTTGKLTSDTINVDGGEGIDGSFTQHTGGTIVVTKGIITSIT